eukprot:CAMPEP_0117426476 /NCGR_PEP_ID=MMETSP0758-20121206/6579_1 /TAXON_ID=63605 /ORGANISM="Percolomonas cosmopolitus, Strain AE-1 (ATCC 50343)" /LENGTH=194 /DNA_ID=CAMNT_0005211661 /DNA_START=508 /DNA_END=1088 /DNA_ORIENTATION=+
MNIQNETKSILYVPNVTFNAAECWDMKDYSTHHEGPKYMMPLKAGEARRFLYKFNKKENLPIRNEKCPLGKLEFGWSSEMGEKGTLTTGMIEATVSKRGPLNVRVIKVEPEKPTLETPFKIKLLLKNTTKEEVDIELTCLPPKMFPILIVGRTKQHFGIIKPEEEKEITLKMISLKTGIYMFGNGMILTNRNKP